jgi:hypothetical protein
MTSTRNLALLADIPTLRRLTQSLAMLDAIVSPDWQMRYHSFNSRWAEAEMMASMRDGSGDGWFLLFCPSGAILKGFAHESPMAEGQTWAGVLSDVPAVFEGFLHEPAFSLDETTFCIWRTLGDAQWRKGPIRYPPGDDPDGSANLMSLLDGNPSTYQQWAEAYYEADVSLTAVEHIYQHRPLTPEIVAHLNADITLNDLGNDLTEIGYPS